MSAPVSHCLLSQAAGGSTYAITRLRERSAFAKKFDGFAYFPCHHDPPCPEISREQIAALGLEIPDLEPLTTDLLKRADDAHLVEKGAA